MVIIQDFLQRVEDLLDRARFPSVSALRPRSCPLCGQPAFSPGKPLGIVGHGTYRRQVLGVVEAAEEAVTVVRRYLCRCCRRTLSVLAAQLHPGRWYAAEAILEALRLHLVDGFSEREVGERLGVEVSSEGWRTLRRWYSGLLVTLWHWLGKRLGVRSRTRSCKTARSRLERLLAEAGPDVKESSQAACRLGAGRVVFRRHSWPPGHDPPEAVKRELLSE